MSAKDRYSSSTRLAVGGRSGEVNRASGLFAVVIDPVDTNCLAAMLDHMQLFGMGYSWGGFESLMIPMKPESVRSVSGGNVDGTLLRINEFSVRH